jgi:hypothetical protein
MGTNYYWHNPKPCETCGHDPHEPKHIGKSSGGWCFSLHVYPHEDIHDIDGWERLWETPGSWIEDEYGERVAPARMRSVIMDRGRKEDWDRTPLGYKSWDNFHEMNHSEPGPAGLLRHQIMPGHCIGHGAGTWDMIVGEFS